MQPKRWSFTPAAVSATAVAALQTLAGAGNLVLSASPYLAPDVSAPVGLNIGRLISLASTGNLSAINFTITGKNADNVPVVEVIAGPNNNTVYTANYFISVSSIAASAAVGTAVSAGIGMLATQCAALDQYLYETSFEVQINGTANCTVQFTEDQVITAYPLTAPLYYINATDPDIVGITASALGNADKPLCGARMIVNSFSDSPLLRFYVLQEDEYF